MIKKFRVKVTLEDDYCHGVGFVHGVNIQIADYLNYFFNINQGGANYVVKNSTIQITDKRYVMLFQVELGEYEWGTECPENMARVITEKAAELFKYFCETGAYCEIKDLVIRIRD